MSETIVKRPANENADPFATVRSSLDWLYLLRRELLKRDVSAMSFKQRRSRDEALRDFARAEALLLVEWLPGPAPLGPEPPTGRESDVDSFWELIEMVVSPIRLETASAVS